MAAKLPSKLEQYEIIKSQINGLGDNIDRCIALTINAQNTAGNIAINGNYLDNGELYAIRGMLNSISSTWKILIDECDQKLEEFSFIAQNYNPNYYAPQPQGTSGKMTARFDYSGMDL